MNTDSVNKRRVQANKYLCLYNGTFSMMWIHVFQTKKKKVNHTRGPVMPRMVALFINKIHVNHTYRGVSVSRILAIKHFSLALHIVSLKQNKKSW